jgi:purine-cytosine permease-like protein
MLWVSKVSVVAATALFGLGFVTYWPQFDAGFAGSGMAWGDHRFWPAFLGAALIVLANPISFGAFLGDWSRYLPARVNKRHLLGVTFLSQILSLLPFLFGLISTSIIARAAPGFLEQADYTGGLLHIAPGAFVLPLFALAILSGLSTGVTSLYGTGLDFSSVIPGLSRAKATLCIGVVSIALIFIGRFAFNLVDSLTTFVSLIVVLTTPWMIIMMIGYQLRRGHYLSDALQVFNRGEEGGAYWFMGGWNVPGMGAWAASGVLALSMVNIPGHFVGWLGSLAGNYDLSLPTAIILPALLYPALMHLIPDPIEVYGSDGAWGVPMAQRPGTPITRRASVAL